MYRRTEKTEERPLPKFRLTATPQPSIHTLRGEIAKGSFLPRQEELWYLIQTQDQEIAPEWVDPTQAPTGLIVRFGYKDRNGTVWMHNPIDGFDERGLPPHLACTDRTCLCQSRWIDFADPRFDAEVVIDTDNHAIWCDYSSRRVQRRFEFEDFLLKCGPPTRVMIGLDGIARYSSLKTTTPDERRDIARRLRDWLVDADTRGEPIHVIKGNTIATTVEADTLTDMAERSLEAFYDEDPFRERLFDEQYHNHYMTGPSPQEIEDALRSEDLAYGGYHLNDHGDYEYILDPVIRTFAVRQHHRRCSQAERCRCEHDARLRALTITRHMGLGSISVADFHLDDDLQNGLDPRRG